MAPTNAAQRRYPHLDVGFSVAKQEAYDAGLPEASMKQPRSVRFQLPQTQTVLASEQTRA